MKQKKGAEKWLWAWGEDLEGGACSDNLYTFGPRPRRTGYSGVSVSVFMSGEDVDLMLFDPVDQTWIVRPCASAVFRMHIEASRSIFSVQSGGMEGC